MACIGITGILMHIDTMVAHWEAYFMLKRVVYTLVVAYEVYKYITDCW